MQYIELGITEYSETYRLQLETLKKVSQGLQEDTLIITEHYPVITIGRRGSWDSILKSRDFLDKKGIEVLKVDRGGDVTYHGPGQLVAYPVFKLEQKARGIHDFLGLLEEAGIDFIGKHGVSAEARHGFRGVWVNGAKVGSIGIGVKKWVTYHGMALNINTDLEPFSFIKPCGMQDVKINSLAGILGRKVDIGDARLKLRESFEKISAMAEAFSF